jgi:rubrerythrin
MTVEQILNEALEREQEAHAFYSRLAAGCSVDCLRELLDKLKDEESKHISLIRKMQVRLEAGQDVLS